MTASVLLATAEQSSLEVSPGVLGFLVTLAVVLACIPLFRSMTSKIRGVQHRDPGAADQVPDQSAPRPPDDAAHRRPDESAPRPPDA